VFGFNNLGELFLILHFFVVLKWMSTMLSITKKCLHIILFIVRRLQYTYF